MAYDHANYQPPGRSYNGRAAQRPGPPQGHDQFSPSQQQYQQQGYDYPQEGYGYEGYDNTYAQDHNYGHSDVNGGGRGTGYQNGGGRDYPPQDPNYHPHQEYYAAPRGGGDMAPPSRGRGGPGPAQRPPTADDYRAGYDQKGGGQGRGYQNGTPSPNGGPSGGRGGRPAPLERLGSSDPRSRGATGQAQRKPLNSPPRSPDASTWDNPFPTFPGTKKKPPQAEAQKITQQMASMDIGAPQTRPRTAGSKGSRDRGPADDYGRPSVDSQRSMPRDYPPRGPSRGPSQQGYQDQRGPPGPAFNGVPRQNSFAEPGFGDGGAFNGASTISPTRENFGPPGRSMTMPSEPQKMSLGRQPPGQLGGGRPDERPYNGPIGKGMPPRPSTASGARAPPQRIYPTPDPIQPLPQQYPQSDPYVSKPANKANHKAEESISDFYDAYYDAPNSTPPRPEVTRSQSNESEMPNFDATHSMQSAPHRRGASIDDHIQPRGGSFDQQNGYRQAKPTKSQPDIRAGAQAQAAVFDMANEAPPMPNSYQGSVYPQNGQYNGQQLQRAPPGQGYGERSQTPQTPLNGPNGYPSRSTSAAPSNNGLRNGFNGLPGGPSPQGANPMGRPRQSPPANGDALPFHPPPVRPGLIPNSVASQAINKPPPVRNYSNMNPAQQPAPSQKPAAQRASAGPVTVQEIEQLRNAIRINPSDQNTQLLLARKLVEASEILIPTIPDLKTRAKTHERYVMDAQKLLKKLVAIQDVDAMFYLADCYGRGALGPESDSKEAFSLYQSAAKLGHAAAAYRTAVCCELGQEDGGGTRKDPLKAIQWYKRAATLGDPPAMYKMGMIQLKGLLGQPKNPREAVGWLKRAAERADVENPHALHELGLLYEQPQGGDGSILRDEAYSFSLFQQAADLGYKFSQFRMGCAFEYGLFNCPIDPRQSIMWYSKAAVQEEHQSELALSGWYLTGSEGVLQQSDTEAYLWARKAAMAGLAKAEYAMGYFTEVGIGSPASLEDAKRWYWRAAAQNFPKARERLEDLKRGGAKANIKGRERISRSKVDKTNEGECSLM